MLFKMKLQPRLALECLVALAAVHLRVGVGRDVSHVRHLDRGLKVAFLAPTKGNKM